jgi:hypothetical protein
MKNLKPLLLTSLLLTLGLLSGCGPSTEQETDAPEARQETVENVAQPLCEISRCNSVVGCPPCPDAEGFCNSRGLCEYTAIGGGGGGGGGGSPQPYCDGVRCSNDSQCVPYCHYTDYPRCVSGYCVP